MDQSYTDDFWTKPGYLGFDASTGAQPSSILAARIVYPTVVVGKLTAPNRLVLETFPTGDLTAIDIRITSGAGAAVAQLGVQPGYVRAPGINATQRTVTLSAGATAIYNAVQVGDAVALGGPEWNFYPLDQFRLLHDHLAVEVAGHRAARAVIRTHRLLASRTSTACEWSSNNGSTA